MSTSGTEHSGHRQRIRKKFIEHGLDVFEPHEALEMYLYYAIPRKDTNPLAHRLLDRYLTIGGVCDSPIDELMNDFGLSESAAVYLKLLPEMSRLYNESKLSDDNIIDFENLGKIFQTKFIGRTNEAVALMLGDAKGKMIYFNIISKGSLNSSDMPIRKIVDLSLRHNAKTAFLAHNHPSGTALPSHSDLLTTKAVRETLLSVGVDLIDHFIVTDDDYVSLRESGFAGNIFFCDD
jgi:DNA repair protein RadC